MGVVFQASFHNLFPVSRVPLVTKSHCRVAILKLHQLYTFFVNTSMCVLGFINTSMIDANCHVLHKRLEYCDLTLCRIDYWLCHTKNTHKAVEKTSCLRQTPHLRPCVPQFRWIEAAWTDGSDRTTWTLNSMSSSFPRTFKDLSEVSNSSRTVLTNNVSLKSVHSFLL